MKINRIHTLSLLIIIVPFASAILCGCGVQVMPSTEPAYSMPPESKVEAYIEVWRMFPGMFPYEKLYATEESIQVAREDMIVERELSRRARRKDLSLSEKHENLLKKFETKRLIKLLYEKKVVPDIQVSDEEIRRYYATNLEEFTQPEEVEIAQIFVEASEGMGKEEIDRARQKIEAALEELHNGKAFEEVAKKYSEAASAERGGRAGKLRRGIAPPAIETAAFSLTPGHTSDIIESTHGFHIIKIIEHYPEKIPPLESVSDRIRAVIRGQKEEEKQIRLLNRVANSPGVETHFDRMRDADEETIIVKIGESSFYPSDLLHRLPEETAPSLARWDRLFIPMFKEDLLAFEAHRHELNQNDEFLRDRQWVIHYLLAEEYFSQIVFPEIQVEPDEAKRYVKEHPLLFIQHEQADCMVLSMRFETLPDHPARRHYFLKSVEEELNNFREEITSSGTSLTSTTFSLRADEYIKNKKQGELYRTGMIIPARRGRFFDMTVEKLSPGELSPVVALPDGAMLIYCIKKTPREQMSEKDAIQKATDIVMGKKMWEARKGLYLEILEEQSKSARLK